MKTLTTYLAALILILWITGCSNNKRNAGIPETQKENVETTYFNVQVEDPYRWLEENNSPKVKQWINEQNNYSDKILSGFPEEKKIESRIEELENTSPEQFSPRLINGKLFFSQFTPPQAQPVIAYKTSPDGKTEILIDPNKMEKGIAITDYWPSPKGNYVAYGTALGGTEATTIHILDIRTHKNLTDSLSYAGGGATPAGMVWDANEKGLTYVRLPLPGTVPDSASQFYAALYHHILSQPAQDDKLVFGKDLSKVAEYIFIPSMDGTQAAMFVHFGDGNADYVYLRKGPEEWKQVLDPGANVRVADEENTGAAWSGDNNLLVISYQDAPQGKLLSITPDGTISTLILKSDWAFYSIAPVKGGFLLAKVDGPDWKVDQYDSKGNIVRTVGLPERGIGIDGIASSASSNLALITYSGWIIPDRWVEYNTDNGNIKKIFEVKPAADYSNVKSIVIQAVSSDSTRVPVTILSMKDITPNGERPTIVYGYGGFGITLSPHFIGPYLLWLENGGVLAYANIRGGGEFGEGWHEAGMLSKKQNCLDDMYAASEVMIQNRWTDSLHLGILGGSNGGLLMGAELTQHPKTFKAVVSFVGIYDMLQNELFPNGQYNTSEYGTVTKQDEFNWLYAYSPYHHVKSGTEYPAILLESGFNDPRVASWQGRKFAAALQDANSSDNPIILITRMDEGHGVTSSFSQRIGNLTAELTFFAYELGLKIK